MKLQAFCPEKTVLLADQVHPLTRFIWCAVGLICWFISSLGFSAVSLSTQCPPGFDKNQQNRCKLFTMYDAYDSLKDKGVGGLKTGLPARRDGFRPEQIDLGRYLFFDPILSAQQDMSCASCHDPHQGFSDGKGRSVGADGKALARGAPTLWNSAFLNRFFWDARARGLEEQAKGPLYSVHEMGNDEPSLLNRLNNSKAYRDLFAQAFPASNTPGIKSDQIYIALAAFESSLISFNSRYDHYAHGYAEALTENELKGLNIFRSFVARCAECHTPPLFTNQQVAVLGTPEPEGLPFDIGAETTFKNKMLKGGFKVPTLRNIAKTAPYMHSGRFANLREAVAFYTKGRGHAVPDGVELSIHWHIWEPNLTEQELDFLVDFLKALTDESFMPRIPEVLPSGLSPLVGFVKGYQKEL
ncbi:MAG: cytochrome-c peroxidase [Zetaproteobacteria bacterium]|nr:cytochrome-c peroxidase [Pseudobdellovibrionaceae bacterium]